ncbi:DNA alkylation repair protein [Actinosynnema pretiosum subsp. pretiosum]|uniref:DNA alkylation repair protein n=1 Tax=Actinosynnema pretiosum subsp. pretiosum TaxID=103721 RepID=A0AA45L7H0_9PSEU|nr:DNA alkylation repair protein [Actinosynnema pretiosum subsp. pretiosum]
MGSVPTADELLSPTTVLDLAERLRLAGTPCPRVAGVAGALDGVALAGRTRLVADAVLADLPEDWSAFEAVLLAALTDPGFGGWAVWPLSEALAARAVSTGRVREGLAVLAALTGRLTGEFALRTFLLADLGTTLEVALAWTASPDEHVRRLASEGTRPFLPWGRRVPGLTAEPGRALPVLEALHADESEYVRRSVANHLNDVSRLDPALVVDVAGRWLAAPAPTTPRLVRHALRTLVKRGDQGALGLLGYGAAEVEVGGPVLTRAEVRFGGELEFTAEVVNRGREAARLAIDYAVHYVKADGSRTPKVFKLTTRVLEPGERALLTKRHPFREITTRRHHAGTHAVELQVNGVRHGLTEFTLTGLPGPRAVVRGAAPGATAKAAAPSATPDTTGPGTGTGTGAGAGAGLAAEVTRT